MRKNTTKYAITSIIIVGAFVFAINRTYRPIPVTINQVTNTNSTVSATFNLLINGNCSKVKGFVVIPGLAYNTPPLSKLYSVSVPTQAFTTLPSKLTLSFPVPASTINKNNYRIGFSIMQKNNGKKVANQTYVETRLNPKPTVQVNCK